MEGDIRMAQQYAGLEKSGLDLQRKQLAINQDMINFNKKMWLANTIISGTQAAVGLTKAAVGLGKAIGDYHDQQSNLAIQTGTTQYQAGVTEAITNGYNPYVTEEGENGEQIRRYVGFDGYKMADGRTLGDLKQDIINTVGNNYWTDSGSERGTQIATNAFENIELNAQRQLANEVMRNRQEVFNQELTNAIEVFRQTGDATQLNTVIDSATWMSDDQRTATRLAAERQANLANINDTAMSIAQTQGMNAVNTYLAEQTLSNEDRAKIFSAAQQASSNASTAAATGANDTFTQMRQDGASIGNAYRAAIANPSDNPAVAAAQKKVAQDLQFNELSNRFGHELAGVDSMSLEELQRWKTIYENRESDYQDQGMLYKQHIDQLDREIAQREGRSSAGSSLSAAESLELAKMYRDKWRAGLIDGISAITSISNLDIRADDRTRIFSEMLQGNDGEFTQAAQAYQRWEQFRAEGLAAFRNNSPERQAYEARTREVLTHLGQMRFTGTVTPDNMLSYVEGIIQTEQTDLLNRAGGIRNLEQVRRMSLSGQLDYMNSNQYDENMNRHSVWLGDTENLYNQFNARETETVSNLLRANDWSIVGNRGVFEERESGDRTGQVHFNIRNSNGETATVRVGLDGKLEKKDGDRWVSFENEVAAGRTEIIRQVDERLTPEARERINTALYNATEHRGWRVPGTRSDTYGVTYLRRILRAELGSIAETENGIAYIEEMLAQASRR